MFKIINNDQDSVFVTQECITKIIKNYIFQTYEIKNVEIIFHKINNNINSNYAIVVNFKSNKFIKNDSDKIHFIKNELEHFLSSYFGDLQIKITIAV